MKTRPQVLFVIVSHLLFFSHLFSLGGNAGLAPLSSRPLPVITPLRLLLRLQ